MIRRLRMAASGPDAAFDSRYLEPIRRLAAYVLALPASSHEAFAGPGGLFRHCLEVAFFSFQAADGRIYTPTAGVETRHALEGRYRYATFMAALLCELSEPLAAVIVTTARGEVWPKYLVPLHQFLSQAGVDRYYVSWPGGRRLDHAGSEVTAIFGHILPADHLTWLDGGSGQTVRDLFAVASGQVHSTHSIMAEVVQTIRDTVRRKEELTRPQRYGHWRCGHHLEWYILDAMRRLVDRGVWSTKSSSPALLFGSDGLYLRWPDVAPALLEELSRSGLPGVPSHPATLQDVLGASGALVANESYGFLWSVCESLDPACKPVTALRWREPTILLGYQELQPSSRPYAEYLVRQLNAVESKPVLAPRTEYVVPDYSFPSGLVQRFAEPGEAALPSKHVGAEEGSVVPEAAHPAVSPPAQEGKVQALPAQSGPERRPKALDRAGAREQPLVAASSDVYRKQLKPSEVPMVDQWVHLLKTGRSDLAIYLPEGAVAIAEEALEIDVSPLVGALDRRGWLGPVPEGARGAKAGMIQFADARKIGFVINRDAVQGLGMAAP